MSFGIAGRHFTNTVENETEKDYVPNRETGCCKINVTVGVEISWNKNDVVNVWNFECKIIEKSSVF